MPFSAETLELEERYLGIEEKIELFDPGLEEFGKGIVPELVEEYEQREGQDNLDDFQQNDHPVNVCLPVRKRGVSLQNPCYKYRRGRGF